MKRIKIFVASFAILFGLGLSVVSMASPVGAVDALAEGCKNNPDSALCVQSNSNDLGTVIKTVVDVLLYILGIISVIVLIIAGIRYSTSQGDPKTVETAKNTILYAIIGIGIAFSAWAIVDWVVGRF